MTLRRTLPMDTARIAAMCRAAGVVRVYAFGSALTDGFNDRSDIDLLVETDPSSPAGLLRLGDLQMDLSESLGRAVHLSLLGAIPPADRARVLASAVRLDAA